MIKLTEQLVLMLSFYLFKIFMFILKTEIAMLHNGLIFRKTTILILY